MRIFFIKIVIFFFISSLYSQGQPISYYLPADNFNPNIPTPASFLGFEVGEWHVSHDQLVAYLRELARLSDRVAIKEYARSHENRPLVVLTITSSGNHKNLDKIKAQHQELCDPATSKKVNINKQPVIVYQGYSIHGNEASGGNASLLVAYYLAASKDKKVTQLLDEAVVLLDPCLNPDGFHRFSTWVNMHKSSTPVSDPASREFREAWPGGRTNHYWFDLNRDWLLGQHPESQGRVRVFQDWKPNILTDHHEMGSNATYFFMPGIPSRTNPLTPPENQELTAQIAKYHAKALDKIGSLYFTEESFDDFYYGKGSTYPDANGCIGILFEQASSRGHLRETINGPLSFPFTIRNQVTTSLSTQEAALGLRTKLLDYQRRFYSTSLEDASKDSRKAIVFGESNDPNRLNEFLRLLLLHEINVYKLQKEIVESGQTFSAGSGYVIPLNQNQYRLIKGMFETSDQFSDSLFYDVSSWTLPLAFDIPYAFLSSKSFSKNLMGNRVGTLSEIKSGWIGSDEAYAYVLPWEDYFSPTALFKLMEKKLIVKVATQPFTAQSKDGEHAFDRGTILIPSGIQPVSREEVRKIVKQVSEDTRQTVFALESGLTTKGIDLGSGSFRVLEKPRPLLLAGDGVSAYEAGEVWHLLDRRYQIPLTIMEAKDIQAANLNKYNCIIMVSGSYNKIGTAATEKLKKWVQEGGTIVGFKNALTWLKKNGLTKLNYSDSSKEKAPSLPRKPYGAVEQIFGANRIGGAIFEASVDLTHPLTYGLKREKTSLFHRGTLFMKPAQNPYATPIIYTPSPLISGYVSGKNLDKIKNSAALVVGGHGRGKVICLAFNPNFRGFWYGTNKVFANALFFGKIIDSRTVEK